MSEENKNTTEKKCDCDDPCDDCTQGNMSNLTGWIHTKDKTDTKDKK